MRTYHRMIWWPSVKAGAPAPVDAGRWGLRRHLFAGSRAAAREGANHASGIAHPHPRTSPDATWRQVRLNSILTSRGKTDSRKISSFRVSVYPLPLSAGGVLTQ